jgi:membrane protease YdiL (CAAX protease family)
VVAAVVQSVTPAGPAGDVPRLLWHLILFPIEIGFVFAYLRAACDARPYQLGLHGHRLGANLILGYLTWFFLAMPVIYLNYQMTGWYSLWKGAKPEDHHFFQMLEASQSDGTGWFVTWLLITVTAVMAAPLREELLFRGLLQPWLVRRPDGGNYVLCWAVFLAFLTSRQRFDAPLPAISDPRFVPEAADRLLPMLFVIIMIPGYYLCHRIFRPILTDRAAARAVYASSLFFAAAHSAVWPTPVALFLLGLGLGYVTYRTRSLVSALMAHAMFNAIPCIASVIHRSGFLDKW